MITVSKTHSWAPSGLLIILTGSVQQEQVLQYDFKVLLNTSLFRVSLSVLASRFRSYFSFHHPKATPLIPTDGSLRYGTDQIGTMPPPQEKNDTGDDDLINVYLRFRPMNKLEASKRSKDCIELHDNPEIVTVDSPLQGLYDFTFDMVRYTYA
jgi:hypothetical protein